MLTDPTGRRWVLTRRALQAVTVNPHVRAVLAAGQVFELVPRGGRTTRVLGTVGTMSFACATEMAEAVALGALPDGLGALLYDPEHWSFTPMEEQLELERHMSVAADAAHDLGLSFIAAPAVTLAKVLSPDFRGDRYDGYLKAGVVRAAASADIVCLQAQNAVRQTDRYADFVARGVDQVRAMNPGVSVIAGLSTNPPGTQVDADMVARAITATATLVTGWWLNVPSPGPRCPTCNPPRPDVGTAALEKTFA